jgi:hypothetical protein
MSINSFHRAVILAVMACLFGGCSSSGTLAPASQQPNAARSAALAGFIPAEAPPGSSRFVQPALGARCKTFASIFAEAAACQRANGTLESFESRKVTWRVRYFVRHWEMPCHEDPTVQEGYIFHMVTDDLYNDPDLNDPERMAIRDAMFDGKIHCKT